MAQLAPSASDVAFSVSSVFSYWKDFDLDTRRSKLDETGLKVASLQEQSTNNRKKLADATREFKRTTISQTDSEYATAAGNLLKQYQEEIDGLTRRAKFAEAAFLDLYEHLSEAPDPAHALAVALENEVQLATTSAQMQKVSTELAEYKAESKAIKNQDLTIRKQEEAIRELTAALEAKEQELLDSRKQAAAEADAAVLDRMKARESELTEMLSSAQSSLEAMQRLYTAAQNQLFELQSSREEVAAGRQEEVELAAAELEAVQARLLALEAQKDNLQSKLEASRQQAAAATHSSSSSSSLEETLRQELNSQREASARLRQDLAASRQLLHDTEAQWEERCTALEEQLSAQQSANDQLQMQLQSLPTVAQLQELQQQVQVLQAVGYGSVEELATAAAAAVMPQIPAGPQGSKAEPGAPGLDSSAPSAGTAAAAFGGGGGSGGGFNAGQPSGLNLEGMLLAKNRKLEHEITMARLAVAEATQELESAREQVSELQEQLQQRQQLVGRLEDDLLAVRQGSSPAAAAAAAPTAAENVGETDANGYESQMMRVIVGQRDRLRQRVQELEVQLASATSELHTAQQSLAAARADNVALIERLRYVGGYRQQAAAARTNAAAAGGVGSNGKGVVGDIESGADVVGKYSQLYDEGINPFKQFQGQQQEQKRKQMSVADKAMYSVGSLVYQSSAARLLAFIYIVILHLLVFGSLTHMTHRTSSHLIDHHDMLLQHGRHDLTSMMHAGSGAGLPAAAAAAVGMSPGPAGNG